MGDGGLPLRGAEPADELGLLAVRRLAHLLEHALKLLHGKIFDLASFRPRAFQSYIILRIHQRTTITHTNPV